VGPRVRTRTTTKRHLLHPQPPRASRASRPFRSSGAPLNSMVWFCGMAQGHTRHVSSVTQFNNDSYILPTFPETKNSVGATYGSKFSLWDTSNLHGGKPCATGTSFPDGGHRFRSESIAPFFFSLTQPVLRLLQMVPHLPRNLRHLIPVTAPRRHHTRAQCQLRTCPAHSLHDPPPTAVRP